MLFRSNDTAYEILFSDWSSDVCSSDLGTKQADGTINHAANSAGSGAVIFNKVSNQAAAWDFVKWFTSTDIQVDYGKQIEALMGPMGRFDTANVEALEQLPWSTAEYEKISSQQSYLREVPIIPASYAVTRHINNAFRMVVNDAAMMCKRQPRR